MDKYYVFNIAKKSTLTLTYINIKIKHFKQILVTQIYYKAKYLCLIKNKIKQHFYF